MKRLLVTVAAALMLAGCGSTEQASDASSVPAVDIWTAAATGDNAAVEQHLAGDADIDAKDPLGGSSALIVASLYGQVDTAKLLVEKGASLSARNNDGATPLHVAAFFCHPELVGYLLEQGADAGAKNGFDQTPLETLSGEWNADVAGLYSMIDEMWKIGLDLERIKEVRPEVADLLRHHAESQ